MTSRFLISALLGVAFFSAASLSAQAAPAAWRAPLVCPLAKHGWTKTPFKGRADNRLTCSDGALRIRSKKSISLHAIRPPQKVAQAGRLSWSWRVPRPAGPSDLTRKGADDRAIAVMVAFRYDPKRASFKERMMRPFVEAKQGPNAPGRVLAYTWVEGRKGASDRELRSPFGGAAHRIIPLPRKAGRWRRETVNIAADHRRAFGDAAYSIAYVAIASDTDDLGGMSDAMIRNLRLQ